MYFCGPTLIILIWNVICSLGSDSLKLSELEENEGVNYFTYTRENKKVAEDIRNVNFNDKFVNVFIIHCFVSNSLDQPLQVKDDLFQYKVDVGRVIIVSWMDHSYASDPSSITSGTLQNKYDGVARYFVPLLAKDLYEKIVHIRKNGAHIIEIIGHGVGAHVAAQTGKLSRSQPINRIFGLNPAGRFFKDRKGLALDYSDASSVVVLHTNINVYGFGSEIGASDIKVNGGKKQPNCKVSVDLCSHNEAWNACSQYLKEKLINQEEDQIHPYVICLDDSSSMNVNKRLERAVHSARQVISNAKQGTFIGIVKFNSRAEIVHDIVDIKGNVERTSLQSSFPRVGINATSIGAGLRLSLNMLKTMPNITQICSTIVLLSDGEHNYGESPKDVLKDLQNECIVVNSIALGQDASKELEHISSSTGGVVSYAMEDGTSQDIVGVIQAFTYTFETYADGTLVNLLSKEVTLSGSKNEVEYTIGDITGEDTEFKFVSYDLDKVNVKLISPNVEVFSSSSSEYFHDDFSKGFRISDAVPGSWNFTVSKISKMKRSIESPIFGTVVANTHQLNDNATIRLNADVSGRVLEYPKPITIRAELLKGEFPVIYAEVFANIKASNQTIIRLQLYDDGVLPDELANDGIYTTDIKKLPKPERYSVTVTARSNGTAMLVQRKIDYFLKDVVDCKIIPCQKLKEFEREADVGSIKLSSQNNEDKIPPGKVNNLRGMIKSETEKFIALEWTSPNDESCSIKTIRYDIRVLINGTSFENGVKFNTSDVVQGSLESNSCTVTKVVNIVIKIPDHIWNYVVENVRKQHWPEFKFALKSVGPNNVQSDRSNIARVIIKDNEAASACSQLRSRYHNLMLLVHTGNLLQTFSIIVLFFLFNIFI